MKRSAFETLVRESLDGLPSEFRDILSRNDIAVIIRPRVPAPVKKQYPRSTVFGIFIGIPYGRFFMFATEPTRIELYQESFERLCRSDDELRYEVRRTVIHEVGHYFGFTEAQLRRLGY